MHEAFMREAIAVARVSIGRGQSPFGCVIVREGVVVGRAHNMVLAHRDPTAHAEVRAIRLSCATMGGIDLRGCDLYTTCEPCPMCFAASHWARVRRVIYGARIADAAEAGFHELTIPAETMRAVGGSEVEIIGGVLRDACAELFREWLAAGQARAY
jgi:tRNA(Arg) A34 adenosine deaminase TadA